MSRDEDAFAPMNSASTTEGGVRGKVGKIERRGGSARTSIYWTHIVVFVFAKLTKGIVHGFPATILDSLA